MRKYTIVTIAASDRNVSGIRHRIAKKDQNILTFFFLDLSLRLSSFSPRLSSSHYSPPVSPPRRPTTGAAAGTGRNSSPPAATPPPRSASSGSRARLPLSADSVGVGSASGYHRVRRDSHAPPHEGSATPPSPPVYSNRSSPPRNPSSPPQSFSLNSVTRPKLRARHQSPHCSELGVAAVDSPPLSLSRTISYVVGARIAPDGRHVIPPAQAHPPAPPAIPKMQQLLPLASSQSLSLSSWPYGNGTARERGGGASAANANATRASATDVASRPWAGARRGV